MVAHGGMGDGKAIVHHCGEATRIAQSIIKRIPLTEPHRGDAITSLNEMILLCPACRISAFMPIQDSFSILRPKLAPQPKNR